MTFSNPANKFRTILFEVKGNCHGEQIFGAGIEIFPAFAGGAPVSIGDPENTDRYQCARRLAADDSPDDHGKR